MNDISYIKQRMADRNIDSSICKAMINNRREFPSVDLNNI